MKYKIILSLKYQIVAENCEWSAWSEWSACTKSCDGGDKTRTRSKTSNEAHGGICCGESSETSKCNSNVCEGDND